MSLIPGKCFPLTDFNKQLFWVLTVLGPVLRTLPELSHLMQQPYELTII